MRDLPSPDTPVQHAAGAIPQTTIVLLRAVRRGDQQAQESLFRRYLPRVRKIVALRMGRKLKTLYAEEDVVQQALLRAFRSLRRFKERSEGTFRNWMARCVENELADLSRKANSLKRGGPSPRRIPLDNQLLSRLIVNPREQGLPPTSPMRRTEERVEEALLELPPHSREIIILRHLCRMSHREIAAELGFSREENSRVALSRALKRLRDSIDL